MPFAKQPSWDHRTSAPVWSAGWRNDRYASKKFTVRCQAITICSGIRRSGIRRMRRLSWPRSACVTTTASIRRAIERATFARMWSCLSHRWTLCFIRASGGRSMLGMKRNSLRQTVKLCSNGARGQLVASGGGGIALAETGKLSSPSQSRRLTYSQPCLCKEDHRVGGEEQPVCCAISPTDGN